MSRSRNTFWAIGLLALVFAGLGALSLLSDQAPQPIAQAAADTIVVHKSPTCGCCGKWVDHLKAEGFAVEVHDDGDMNAVKSRLGIPARLASTRLPKKPLADLGGKPLGKPGGRDAAAPRGDAVSRLFIGDADWASAWAVT